MPMIDLHQEVMVVDLFALEGITRCPLNGIGVSGPAAGNKISDASVFMALIVVHVSGEHHETGRGVSLAILQYLSQSFL